MVIDGKQIAEEILQNLQKKVVELKKQGVMPTLAAVLVGDNPTSESYVRQKQKAATQIGAILRCTKYAEPTGRQDVRSTKEEIQHVINQLNNDPAIHGIILQLPLPPHFHVSIHESIYPNKDVDGFVPNSKFKVPVALAVEKILQRMYEIRSTKYDEKEFYTWLTLHNIVIIGRGETAGKPIAEYLINQGYNVPIVHSQTSEKERQCVIKNADIIISCVGKHQVISSKGIKKGVILISVGIWRDSEGKPHGDYEEDDIKGIASFYTPTPGGVGPVNVACLMQNLILAASRDILHKNRCIPKSPAG
jgi:methylenetetrahydrofolate dehydrogenase (NADP+)/methenyltetrahydrofolate cyclohydrolase